MDSLTLMIVLGIFFILISWYNMWKMTYESVFLIQFFGNLSLVTIWSCLAFFFDPRTGYWLAGIGCALVLGWMLLHRLK